MSSQMVLFQPPSQVEYRSGRNFAQKTNTLWCPYCPATCPAVEDQQAGDLICTGCGLVLGDRIVDVGAEWRTFSNDTISNKSRVGAEENQLFDGYMDLATTIGSSSKNYVEVSDGSTRTQRRYRNKKFLNSTQRTLVYGYKEIAEMAEKLNTSRPILECAQLMFKKVQSKASFKGRSNESVAAACIYVAFRKYNVPRTFKEICAVSKAPMRCIAKSFQQVGREIGGGIEKVSVQDYIPRFVAKLNLSARVEKNVLDILDKIVDLELFASRNPCTIAALAIYMATKTETNASPDSYLRSGIKRIFLDKPDNSRVRLQQISEVTGAAEITIKEVYQILQNQAAEHFPETFEAKGGKDYNQKSG